MEEDLPSEFDLIVLGTGMPESVLAAAAARCGKSVLHLDRNDFYGSNWGSFNFEHLQEWSKSHSVTTVEEPDLKENLSSHVKEDETLLILQPKKKLNFNVSIHEFIPQSAPETDKTCEVKRDEEIKTVETEEKESEESDPQTQISPDNQTESNTEIPPPTEATEQSTKTEPVVANQTKPKVWTIEELFKLKRKFNLDLAPKLLFSRGALVELLIQSNISRYAEFKCSSQILTLLDGNLMPVPCSRADVFSTKHVSIVEKRMLMKLLKFCLDFEDHPDEFKDYENKPFIKFLTSKKLTKNVEHYLVHSIAMVDPNHPTIESLKKIQKFLQSLGRYGNSPFLFPLYGSGEMPQCFCRLCAVFGGVYCLKRSVDALILNKEGVCVAAVMNNKRIDCKFLAGECGYFPDDQLPNQFYDHKISKAIFITDAPIFPSEHDDLTFLRLPACDSFGNAVNVLELGPSSNVCPGGLRVVHMSCTSQKSKAIEDLLPAAQLLFNTNKTDGINSDKNANCDKKPNILWAMYLNQYDNSWLELNEKLPGHVFALPTPDIEQDYEVAIGKAKDVFLKMFPSDEFLPRAPEPEEIVMDDPEPSQKDTDAAKNPDEKVEDSVSASENFASEEGESKVQKENEETTEAKTKL